MNPMTDIENRTRAYAEARTQLGALVASLQDGLDALKKDQLPAIKRAVRTAAERHATLQALIEDNPGLFTRPRSVVLHGVKIGFEKGKGTISFDDGDKVVSLIERKLPDQADVLIKTEKTPVKKALAQLSDAQLKSIGCQVGDATDVVIIRPVDSGVEKLVTAMLKGAEAETP